MSRSSAADPAETLSSARVRLCGQFALEAAGREIALRGRQARLIVAFLCWHRRRAVGRDELIELLWPADPPTDPDEVLSALLSKLRSALGAGALRGRRELSLAFGDDAWIDVEAAMADLSRAEAAVERGDWAEVARAGHDVLDATTGTFLLGHDHLWVEERRRDVEELRLRALEHVGDAGLALGGSGIGAAERSARALIAAAPFRESGPRLLMQALAARGETAEALRVYDALRRRLRDELGTAPSAATRDLHARLLSDDQPAAERPRDERKLVSVVAGAGHEVAIFGVPRAREDDAERAVRAALALGVRAAVVTGDVIVRSGTPSGEPLDRAVALLRDVPPGAVVVDELTARLTEHDFEYERTGRAFRPVGPRSRPAPRSTFVGREHELAVLERLHRTVVEEGRPRAVLVVGDAGAGKSRLVDELAGRIRGGSIHAGRCLAYGDGLTYWPLRELLWSIAGIALDDTAAEAAARLRALIDRTAAEPERTAQALAVSAGIALPGNPLAELEPESVAEEVALAWPRFASGLAARAPAVLVIEDLHWGEPALLGMVEQLVARSAGPLLVVATARPELLERRPGWGARTASQLVLEPLTRVDAQRLVTELLPGAAPPLRERVITAAEGNPFFAEEIAHHLRDRAGEVTIPTTVRAVLAARLDALPGTEKRALQDAAVVGRSFWASSLAAPPAALRALEERGLVITRPTSSLPGQTELAFRHALIREVAYRSIPDAQRRAAHAAVGDWIAGLAGDRREEFVELLAHHYERAAATGEPMRAKAVAALLEAGGAARRRAATDEALQFAERALALAHDDERLGALELRARTLHSAVRADEALTAYLSALELAGDDDAARLRAHAVLLCSRYPGAFTRRDWSPWAVAAIERGLAEAPPDSFERGAMLIGRASMIRWFPLPPEQERAARDAAEDAIAIAERIGSTSLLSHALEATGWRDADSGFCEAGATADRMLELVGRMPDRIEAAESMVIAAICLLRAGRFDEALDAAAEAGRVARHLSPHRRLHAASAQTTCLVPPGRLAELAEATADAFELVSDESARTCAMGSLALAGHALACFESGDSAAGERAAELLETTGLHRRDSAFRMRGIELLRPFVHRDRSRRRLAEGDDLRGLVDGVHQLRVLIQLAALDEDEPIAPVAERARALGRQACAPALTWMADWAEAVRARALPQALAAAAALDAYGEHYTAARLEVDALVRMPDVAAAAATAARLERMGALASAAELSGSRAG